MMEEMLLAQLMNNKELFYKLKVTVDYFTAGINQAIFKTIDLCVTVEELEPNYLNLYQLNKDLPIDQLSKINEKYMSASNWEYYETGIIQEYKRRKLFNSLAECKEMLTAENVGTTVEKLENIMTEIVSDIGFDGYKHITKDMGKFIDKIQERRKAGGELVGQPTPWPTVNKYTLGLQPRLLYILAARPSQGKTAAALNIMTHLTFNKNIPIGFLSCESSALEMIGRILSANSGIPLTQLKTGSFKDYQYKIFDEETERMRNIPFYICDTPNMKLSDICSNARRMVITKDIKVLFIDYLQIIDAEIGKGSNRIEQVREISITIKALARQLNIPIVLLSQLNRMTKEDKIPHLGNLAESSQIEKDADVVIMIYHDDKNKDGTEKTDTEKKSYFLVEKNRDGQTGRVQVYFNKPTITFREMEK